MLITFLIVLILFPCIFGSLLDNKASGALPFFQRQFWSCVKVFTLNAARQRLARFSVKVKLQNGLLCVCDRPFVIVGHVINFLFKPENSSLFENFVSRNSTLQTK